jgi:methyl-accepting chemotaxis protein
LPGEDGATRRREAVYRLRLSEEERHQLRMRAAASGVTMSRLLVDSALRPKVTPHEREALAAQFNRSAAQLGKIGSNVNQLAFWANSEHQTPGDLSDVADQVTTLVNELRQAADEIVRTVRG